MWDDAGRLKEVKISSSTVGTYTYNAFNQRTKKVASSTTTHYVYGAGGLLYGEYDSSGNLVREYVYLNGAPLAQIDAGSPEVLTYLHTDQLGTPKYATNTSGTQVWSWAPDAFGNGSSPSGSVTINLRMPGQYYDAESDIFYNWNRYYNPEIGRYISSDPIGLAGGINTFSYVGQTPLMLDDPLGLVVQMCKRPVDISWIPDILSEYFLPDHMWVKTDEYESGMGGECTVPGQGCSDVPYSKVSTTDQSGQSQESNSTCRQMHNIDEKCVNNLIAPGQSLGRWTPSNQCNSFVYSALSQCAYGPPAGPDVPPCTFEAHDPNLIGPQLPYCERVYPLP